MLKCLTYLIPGMCTRLFCRVEAYSLELDTFMLNSSRGEAETKAFSALDQDEAEAFVCGTMLRVAAVA